MLKLYVWEDFAPQYAPGLAFAIAETEEEAKEIVSKIYDTEDLYFTGDPEDVVLFHWGKLKIYPIDKIAFARTGGQ